MKKILFLFILMMYFGSVGSAYAQKKGTVGGGGGDIQCDALIKSFASNLKSWLQNKGPEGGHLDLSPSLNPHTQKSYTYSEYESQMIQLLDQPIDVSCVGPGDHHYPVAINDSTKICTSNVDRAGVHMVCNRELFMSLNADLQIEQTHHEFAIHISGLEPDVGAISTYRVSTQLSNSIGDVIERRLVIIDADALEQYKIPAKLAMDEMTLPTCVDNFGETEVFQQGYGLSQVFRKTPGRWKFIQSLIEKAQSFAIENSGGQTIVSFEIDGSPYWLQDGRQIFQLFLAADGKSAVEVKVLTQGFRDVNTGSIINPSVTKQWRNVGDTDCKYIPSMVIDHPTFNVVVSTPSSKYGYYIDLWAQRSEDCGSRWSVPLPIDPSIPYNGLVQQDLLSSVTTTYFIPDNENVCATFREP